MHVPLGTSKFKSPATMFLKLRPDSTIVIWVDGLAPIVNVGGVVVDTTGGVAA